MINGKKVIALLPMKAHSQRVKNKNFRDFCGRPLFHHVLGSLLNVSQIDKILINTDAFDQIMKLGLPEGWEGRVVIRRRKRELCGDKVSMNLIIADDLEASDGQIYIMTHATNPLLTSHTICKALETYLELQPKNDSLFSVDRIQARVYDADGLPINHVPNMLLQTQDLLPCYVENSNLYIFSKWSFMQTDARIGLKPYMYEMDEMESVDIDTEEDWNRALLLFSNARG